MLKSGSNWMWALDKIKLRDNQSRVYKNRLKFRPVTSPLAKMSHLKSVLVLFQTSMSLFFPWVRKQPYLSCRLVGYLCVRDIFLSFRDHKILAQKDRQLVNENTGKPFHHVMHGYLSFRKISLVRNCNTVDRIWYYVLRTDGFI